jgi:nitrile hydratase accessory protein
LSPRRTEPAETPPEAHAALAALPEIPRDDGGPVFRAPWEAQAFALAVALHDKGVFAWAEFAAALGAEIARAEAAGDCRGADAYYVHWLAALERLAAEKGVVGRDSLLARKDAWDRAARATPHGEPIVLGRGD